MIAPKHYQATLREAPLDADPDSKNPAISGAWLGMSISGEVTAPVVYAHSGNPEDYDLLRKNGISVKGKIVLVRYSNPYSYRGFKALTAQREGAAAILIRMERFRKARLRRTAPLQLRAGAPGLSPGGPLPASVPQSPARHPRHVPWQRHGKTTVAGIEADYWLQHDHPYQQTPVWSVQVIWVCLKFRGWT